MNGRPIWQLREEWEALRDAETLDMLPTKALVATIRDLASKLLVLTQGEDR